MQPDTTAPSDDLVRGFAAGSNDAQTLTPVEVKEVLATPALVLAQHLDILLMGLLYKARTRAWSVGYTAGFLSVIEEARAKAAMSKTKRLRRILDDLCKWLAPMRNIDTYRFQQEAESQCTLAVARLQDEG